ARPSYHSFRRQGPQAAGEARPLTLRLGSDITPWRNNGVARRRSGSRDAVGPGPPDAGPSADSPVGLGRLAFRFLRSDSLQLPSHRNLPGAAPRPGGTLPGPGLLAGNDRRWWGPVRSTGGSFRPAPGCSGTNPYLQTLD